MLGFKSGEIACDDLVALSDSDWRTLERGQISLTEKVGESALVGWFGHC